MVHVRHAAAAMRQAAGGDPPLRRAVSINPKLADAQYRLGDALMRSGHGDQAIRRSWLASSSRPTLPKRRQNLPGCWRPNLIETAQRQRRGLPRQPRQRTREILAAIPGSAGGGVRGAKAVRRAAKTASDAAELADAPATRCCTRACSRPRRDIARDSRRAMRRSPARTPATRSVKPRP